MPGPSGVFVVLQVELGVWTSSLRNASSGLRDDDRAGSVLLGRTVDEVGLAVEVRGGDVVVAVVVVLVGEQAGDAVHVAETLGVAVLDEPRGAVEAAGDGALQSNVLLSLVLGRRVGLAGGGAVAPLRRNAGVRLVAVLVGAGGVAEGEDLLAGLLVPGEALATDVVAQATGVSDGAGGDEELVGVVLGGDARLDPLLHVVVRDGEDARRQIGLRDGAEEVFLLVAVLALAVRDGLGLGDRDDLGLAVLGAVGLDARLGVGPGALADFFLGHDGTGEAGVDLLRGGATLNGVVVVGVVDAGLVGGLGDLLLGGLLGALVGGVLSSGDFLGEAADLHTVVNGHERVVAVAVVEG